MLPELSIPYGNLITVAYPIPPVLWQWSEHAHVYIDVTTENRPHAAPVSWTRLLFLTTSSSSPPDSEDHTLRQITCRVWDDFWAGFSQQRQLIVFLGMCLSVCACVCVCVWSVCARYLCVYIWVCVVCVICILYVRCVYVCVFNENPLIPHDTPPSVTGLSPNTPLI
jgi:hypothetical protein